MGDNTTQAIDFTYAEEIAVASIEVERTNYGTVRLQLVDIDRSENQLKETIDMLLEAICMLREEIGEIRLANLRDCPF